MKKVVLVVFLVSLLFFNTIEDKEEEEVKGVFISYIELSEKIKGQKEEQAKKNIDEMIKNIRDFQLNTIILQVRPMTDAIYLSSIFPYSDFVKGESSFDVLDYFLKVAHKNHLKLIAWINPYRISNREDISIISKDSPAYPYLNTDTIYIHQGIYWNPAKEEVTDLIVAGIREVLEYPIDGIIMDDYFYPDDFIDQKDYESYQRGHEDITLQEYHLQIINDMVLKVHQECQRKKVKFGISPDGNIDNNYQKNYADVKRWMQDNTYIDFIIPQIYYGFYNSTRAYVNTIHEWESFLKSDKVDFYVALAFYKVGREDFYAKAGRNEWLENDDIIMKEVLLSRNLKNYKGFFLFRYDHIFEKETYTSTSQMEFNNLKKVIK